MIERNSSPFDNIISKQYAITTDQILKDREEEKRRFYEKRDRIRSDEHRAQIDEMYHYGFCLRTAKDIAITVFDIKECTICRTIVPNTCQIVNSLENKKLIESLKDKEKKENNQLLVQQKISNESIFQAHEVLHKLNCLKNNFILGCLICSRDKDNDQQDKIVA